MATIIMTKLQKLLLKELINLFNQEFQTNRICRDLFELVPKTKLKKFILDRFEAEFTVAELEQLL